MEGKAATPVDVATKVDVVTAPKPSTEGALTQASSEAPSIATTLRGIESGQIDPNKGLETVSKGSVEDLNAMFDAPSSTLPDNPAQRDQANNGEPPPNDSTEKGKPEPLTADDIRAEARRQMRDGVITPEQAQQTIDNAEAVAQRNTGNTPEESTPIPGLEGAGQEAGPTQPQPTENQTEAPTPEDTTNHLQPTTESTVQSTEQAQEASPQTQPAAETLPPTNDQLIAQEDNLQQQLNKGEITQEQYRKDMGNLAEQTDMNSSQVGTPESTTIHEPTSDERANGAEVTNNGESMELTPEQKARFEGMQIASELSNLGIDLKSNAGLELARAIAENPALMETVKQTAEAMTKYQETFGPTATQDSAEATQKSLEEQAAKAEATGDKNEVKRVKGLLKILLAITAALAIVAGASVTVGVGQLGNQTK